MLAVNSWRIRVVSAALLAVSLFGFEPALAASRIGVAAAVRNDVQDVTGGAAHKMAPGSGLFEQQVVKTGEASAAQLLFLDETSMSLGPKAQIKLDKFVYDPSKKTGDVVIAATKGAFRFVSGAQDPRSYQIKTPVATIGVRGTIVDCYMISSGLLCIVQEGEAIVAGKVVKAGQAIFVAANGDVTGPFTPDGQFYAVSGIFPFPLYGQDLGEVVKHLDIGDSKEDIIDQINGNHDEPPPHDEPPAVTGGDTVDTGDTCDPEDCECSEICR